MYGRASRHYAVDQPATAATAFPLLGRDDALVRTNNSISVSSELHQLCA